jgi:hypothetical protein
MESSKESAGPSTPFQLAVGLQAMNAAVTPHLDMTLPASPDRSSTRAESLSPASSSSSSITDLASRLGPSPSAAAIQAAKDADAKSSALKALAGISKVVSRSRQVDAEALQAIKLQRAKVKAEGGPGSVSSHRHTRTLSTESLPSLPELTGTSLPSITPATGGSGAVASGGGFSTSTSSSMMPPPPSRGHRRSHSGIPLSSGGGGGGGNSSHLTGNGVGNNNSTANSSTHLQGGVIPPYTSPQSYSELLSGMGLADLLALQTAVDTEIQTQLSAAGLTPLNMGIGASPTGTHSPQSPADVLLSAQYASAVLASQQQQQLHASAFALQQALAGVASGVGMAHTTAATGSSQQQQHQMQYQQQQQQQQQQQRAHSTSGGSLGHSPIYGRSPKKGVPPFSSSGSGGSGGSGGSSNIIKHQLPHHSHHSRSRSIDAMILHNRSSSPLTPDSGSSGGLTAAASSNLSFGGLDGGAFHMDLTSMEDFVGGPQPPPTARSLDIGAPQPPRETSSAAFTSPEFSFLGASGNSLLVAPENVEVAPSPFTRSSSGSLGQPSFELEQQHAANEQQQQQQQLPLLFGNLQLGSFDPWR